MIRKNINNIITGWFNLIIGQFGIIPEGIKKEAERRLKICEICIDRNNNNCGLCGCYLPAKARDPQSKCPKQSW